MRRMWPYLMILMLNLIGLGYVWAQQAPQPQATPCDVQVQILQMGRQNAEAQLAQAIVQIRDMEKKVADVEAKTKSAEKK
jgi:TolA-binding protein